MYQRPIMLPLGAKEFLEQEWLETAVSNIKSAGFDSIVLEFRDSQYDEYDDTGLQAMRTVCSMNLLAGGIAKYTESGIVFNMCWDRLFTCEKFDYFIRVLAVWNVR